MDLSQQTIQKTWDSIAFSFDKTRKRPWKQCIDFIKTLPHDTTAGDFGCGNGRHTLELAAQCKHVIGIDISLNLLQIIQKKICNIHNIDLIHANLLTIPLKKHSLDAVLYIASLHNIPKRHHRLNALKELYRVLKEDGNALISVWAKDQRKFKDINTNAQRLKISNELEPGDAFIYWTQDNLCVPRYYHLYEKQEILDDVERVGFDVCHITSACIVSKTTPDNFFIQVKK